MNSIQKPIFAIYMTILCGILVLQHLLSDNFFIMGIVLFTTMCSMFIASRFIEKPTRSHKTAALAIAFVVLGDTFLVLLGALPGPLQTSELRFALGMVGFLGAYITLTVLFTKKFSFTVKDRLLLIPVLIVIIPVQIVLVPIIENTAMAAFGIFFALAVGFMAWNALCTIHRGYYTKPVAKRFAAAGFLILLSDMGVAFAMFYPGMGNQAVPLLENEIWITYVPAWSLILMNLLESKLEEERIS